jgi:hypothetical protein
MHPQETTVSARRAFLERLIDDAGLFPPAALALPAALAVDDAARAGAEAWMLGRFIVPAARFGELVTLHEGKPEPLPVSTVVDGGHVARDLAGLLEAATGTVGAVEIEAIELKLPDQPDGDVRSSVMRIVADIDASGLPRAVGAYLEFGFGSDWRAHVTTTLDALADARARSTHPIRAKVRCGGTSAAAVPNPERLAFAFGTLRALGVPFKATAGLHHPVRRREPAGSLATHGFLNVIGVAVLDYELDLDERTRQQMLGDEDPASFRLEDDAFGWKDLRVDGARVAAARREFVHSFGSCSLDEPVSDLFGLGILI